NTPHVPCGWNPASSLIREPTNEILVAIASLCADSDVAPVGGAAFFLVGESGGHGPRLGLAAIRSGDSGLCPAGRPTSVGDARGHVVPADVRPGWSCRRDCATHPR